MAKTQTFSQNIDSVSENIIYLLSLNSRMSVTGVSRTLGVPRRIIEHRIKKLYQKGFMKPLLIFHYPTLTKATILIKLSRFDTHVIKSLIELERFVKVKETLGEYDLSLLVITEDSKDLDRILTKIDTMLHDSIQKLDVIYHDAEDTLGMKSFCHDAEILKRYTMLSPSKSYIVTNEDKKIIDCLKHTSLISFKELSKTSELGYQKISETVARLLDKEIIRFSIDPEYEKLGLEFHNILVKINLAKRSAFEGSIIRHPRVHWVKKGTGAWDYVLSVTARDIGEFIDITRDIRTQNQETILNFTTLISKIHVQRKI